MSILIKNARVITLDSENSILEDACVYIKDGIIESVGAEPGVSADRCIDAAGKTVLPGFVNTHTHLPMNLFRSYADDMPLMTWLEEKIWPSEARMDPRFGSMGTSVEEGVSIDSTTGSGLKTKIKYTRRTISPTEMRRNNR